MSDRKEKWKLDVNGNLFTAKAGEDLVNGTLIAIERINNELVAKVPIGEEEYLYNVLGYVYQPYLAAGDPVLKGDAIRCKRALVNIFTER